MKNTQYGLGAIRSLFDLRDYRAEPKKGFKYCFADSFNLTMPPVKNQGQVCSCVAHAIAAELEYFDKKETGSAHRLSTNYIYGNRRDTSWKQKGMRMRDAIKAAKKYGDVSNRSFPGNTEVPEVIEEFEQKVPEVFTEGSANKIGRYFRLYTADAIKACLVDYGPVVFSVDWNAGYRIEGDKLIIPCDSDGKSESHCMLIYGWCPDGWLIQNSWGTGWGSGGRAVLPYDTVLNEAWGIEDAENTVGDNWLDITAPFSSTIGKKVAEIINSILNFVFRK